MRQHSLPIGIFALACGLLVQAAPAWAAALQTWVSGTGSDSGTTCPITAPCRTFQYAHDQTSSGGTIYVLSSGIFGPLTITKSIRIDAEGVEGSIHTSAGGGININTANIVVYLRGLTLDISGLTNAIHFRAGAALHIQNSVIRRSLRGIQFQPPSGTGELYVTDSVIADAATGLSVFPTSSGSAKVWLDRVRFENNTNGILISGTATSGTITATIRDSAVVGGGTGLSVADGSSGGAVTVMFDRSSAVNNTTGIIADGATAKIRLGDSTVSGNGTGLSIANSGVISSFQTNRIIDNTSDGPNTRTARPEVERRGS
jgi:hypothetical protein